MPPDAGVTGQPRAVLVAGWVGSTNLGDELLFDALHAKLAARGAAAVPISVDPAATAADHGVDAVGHLDPAGWWRTLGGRPGRVTPELAPPSGGRMVVGGGGLWQDESSRLNVPYHLSRVAVARAASARVVGVGLGGGRLFAPSRALLAATLRGVPLGARDRATCRQLSELGLDARLTGDLALSLPSPSVPARDELVVCLRPRNLAGGLRPASSRWREGLPSSAQASTVADRLGQVASSLGLAVRFVALQADRDGVLHRLLADRLADRHPAVEVSCVAPTRAGVLDEVARGRLVVAMRFHAAVAGLLAGRPTVAAAYSSKVAELASDAPATVSVLDGPLSALAPPHAEAALRAAPDAMAGELATLRAREAGNDLLLDDLLLAT